MDIAVVWVWYCRSCPSSHSERRSPWGGGFAPSRVEGASQVRRPHLCAHSPSSFEIAIKKGETDTEMYGQIEAAMLETCIHAVEKMGETNDWLLQPC